MAFKTYHADGTTLIDSANPLECSYSSPGTVKFVCDGQYEETKQSVALLDGVSGVHIPVGFEVSIDGGQSWTTTPLLGVVSTTPVPALVRPISSVRTSHAQDLGGGRYACVPEVNFTAVFGGLDTAPDTVPPALGASFSLTGGAGTLVFAWSAATDDRGTIASYQYQYADDPSFTISPVSGTLSGSATGISLSGVAAGVKYGRYRAFDGTNYSPWVTYQTATVTSTGDSTKPVLGGSLSLVAGNGKITASGLSATDNVAVHKFQYQLDGGAWTDIPLSGADATPATMPATDITCSNYTSHSLVFQALDAADNTSTTTASGSATPTVPFTKTTSGLLFADAFNEGATSIAQTITENSATAWSIPSADRYTGGGILLTSGGKLRWTRPTGSTTIQMRALCLASGNVANQVIQMRIPAAASEMMVGMGVRVSGRDGVNDLSGYLLNTVQSGTDTGTGGAFGTYGWKWNDGVATGFENSPTTTITPNELMMVSAIDTAIAIWKNGTSILSMTDSGVASGYPALAFDDISGNTTSTFDVDNFVAMKHYNVTVAKLPIGWYVMADDGGANHATATAWTTGHTYAYGDVVTNGGNTYYCLTAHTSGTFSTDLNTNHYWRLVNYVKSAVGTGSGTTTLDCHALDFTVDNCAGITLYFHHGDPGTSFNNASTLESGLTKTGVFGGDAWTF